MRIPRPPWALLRASPPGRPDRCWLAFERPAEVLETRETLEVPRLLERIDEATRAGYWAVGFLTYETAPAFDDALVTRPGSSLPMAWFAVFEQPTERPEPPSPTAPAPPELRWRPTLSRESYGRAIDLIREHIAQGDTYQVNFTWRLDAPFAGDPWAFFHRLGAVAPPDHASFVDTGRHALCSLSPELFFRLERGRLTCRPMKGTLARGRTVAEDRRRALELFDSPKNRAENLMIVDMIRNDLGRIARPGSVRVESLFDLESHETVFQLTSTVTAESDADLAGTLAALFPCASVTGAPKVRTMELIAELEDRPRGVYTGALGYFAPGGHAELAVAIRTVWIDREVGRAEYGTGGGIVWDSSADAEYAECLAKTRVLAAGSGDFELLETLLWTAEDGYRRFELHLERLLRTATRFQFRLSRELVATELSRTTETLRRDGDARRVVRLTVSRDGTLRITTRPVPAARPWRLALARTPIDPEDVFLFHKTTRREVYDRARDENPGYDDVLLWNPAGALTESTVANLALRRRGEWLTPPVEAGLLAGCERQALLDEGRLGEAPLSLSELGAARGLALVNSVRGWIDVERVEAPESGRVIWQREEPAAAGPGRNPSREDP